MSNKDNLKDVLEAEGFKKLLGTGAVDPRRVETLTKARNYVVDSNSSMVLKYAVPLEVMDEHLKPGEGVKRLVLVFDVINPETGFYEVKGYVER